MLYEDENAIQFGGVVRELPMAQDAEDQYQNKQRNVAIRERGASNAGAVAAGLIDPGDDDSDDDTNSYKTLSSKTGVRKYDLVLVMMNTDMTTEQEQNFIKLLHQADGLLSQQLRQDINGPNISRRYHYRFRSIFYPKQVEDIVGIEIIQEGNQRVVLAHDSYKKCMKFKKNMSRLVEELKSKNSNKTSKYMLPMFDIKVLPIRHSLKYNFGQKQTLKANYQDRQSILATQQTRSKYKFEYNPVLHRINTANK